MGARSSGIDYVNLVDSLDAGFPYPTQGCGLRIAETHACLSGLCSFPHSSKFFLDNNFDSVPDYVLLACIEFINWLNPEIWIETAQFA
jgi:hypothetical protein